MNRCEMSEDGSREAAADAALWLKNLADSSNSVFLPLFFDQHRYLVLKGGGGSGKSIFAGRKVIERVVSEAGHRYLVCRKVARTLRESCFRQLLGQLAEFYSGCGYTVNKTDMVISFPNGSQILFAGLDDVEKLKSIYNITGIWIEEASEISESDFNQLDIRLRGETKYYKQIILTFNPVSILHWLKARFFDRRDPNVRTHESTYRDNRFLDADAVRVLESFKETDEYYYSVYCLGEWGVTGRSVFDSRALTARLLSLPPPVSVGYFDVSVDGDKVESFSFVEDRRGGFIEIYSPPEAGAPYVIGGDTAGDGSDSFVAQVIDNRTGVQVARLRHSFDEDLYALQVYALGRYYGDALVAVECNFSTYPTLRLERLRYPNLYVRESVDEYTHVPKKSFGFLTTPKTRPLIISELIRAVREDVNIIFDRVTIEEMLTFVRNESFRPEAEEGAHDDCVISLAIAHFVRPLMRMTAPAAPLPAVEWTRDMREDYDRASPSEREYLLRKWGRPL